MAKTWSSWKSLGTSERILAVLFAVGFILGFLLTPLGFETRSNDLRSVAFAGFFIVVGLLLPLAGLIILFRSPKLAGVLAVVAAALNFLIAPADQATFFFTVAPPAAVTVGEYILILVGIGYMIYGIRIYDKDRTTRKSGRS